MPDDGSFNPAYSLNAMQMAAGLMPPFATSAPAIPFPGQVSAQFAQGGMAGAMGFSSPIPTFTGGPQMMPGPGGVFMPMQPGGPAQAFGGYGLGGMGPMTPPNIYTGYGATTPAPMYRGPMGQPPNMIAPGVAPSFFNTPFQAGFAQQQATDDRWFSMGMAGYGSAARTATDFGAAGAGAYLGHRFGGAKGAVVGGALGFLGSEFGGLGQAGQNFFMNNFAAPAINMRAYGAGIQEMSQGFVSSGAHLGMNGVGFSRGASVSSARMLEDMSNSDTFRRDTFNRFNTADVMRIAQGAGQNGMMQGVSSPEAMRDRVRDVAKQLQSFMELANEPDVQRAIQTMGNLRSQGLGINETMQAVQNGRAFARMAGTTFENLMNVGGAQGAMTFGSMGMTQGLGTRVGMGNYGMAASAQNMGMLSPQVMNLMGGAGGLANMNNMFSAGVLQMPMLAPAMMNSQGGINANNIMALAQGRVDPMSMTSMGANNLGAMTSRMGIGGLGMAVGMQPMLQDAVGRMMQSQGPFAQRNMEDRQVMALARRMGLRGSEGFMTAAQMMGMSGTQAMSRAQEMADPRHYDRMRDQLETRRMEHRDVEERDRLAREPGLMDTLASNSDMVFGARSSMRGLGRGVRDAYESIAGGGPSQFYSADSASERRSMRTMLRSREYQNHLAGLGRGAGERSGMETFEMMHLLAEGRGGGRGLIAGVSALANMGMSDDRRESRLRNMQEGGRFMSDVLNSSSREQNVAMRHLGRTFGGSHEALDEFSRRFAEMHNNPSGLFGGAIGNGAANLAFRGGVQFLSRGMIDPGNIAGSRQTNFNQLRDAYVGSMHGRSDMSDEQLRRHFDANRSTIAMQAAPMALLMTTRGGRSELESQNARAAGISDPMASRESSERDAYSGLLGSEAGNSRSRRAFDSLDKMFGEGFGSNQSARDRSRQLMTSLAILNVRQEKGGARGESHRQMQAVVAEARRRGMSETDVNEAVRRVAGKSQSFANIDGLDEVAQHMNVSGSGGALLDRVAGTERGRTQTSLDATLGAGAGILGRQRGQLGRLFSGVSNGGNFDRQQLMTNLTNGHVDLEELAEQNPGLARLVRQYQNGNERQRNGALAGIEQAAFGQGERFNRMEARAHEMGRSGRAREGWRRGRGLGAIFGAIRGAAANDTEWARDQLRGGTHADDDAIRQSGDIDSMQSGAESAGIGGASDALLRAARSLEEATKNLNGTANSGILDSLMGGGT